MLLLVIVSLVVMAIMASGTVLASLEEVRAGRRQAMHVRAQAVAEYGLNSQLASWPASRGALAVGSTEAQTVPVADGDTAYVTVVRLPAGTFLITSVGRARMGTSGLEAERRVSLVVRSGAATATPRGVLTTRGPVRVGGNLTIDGRNTAPPGWSSCAAAPDTVALAYNPANAPTAQGSYTLLPTPGMRANPAAADAATYTTFGAESWNSLVARATLTIPGGTLSGVQPVGSATACTTGGSTNWGEPNRSGSGLVAGCQGYLPLIYSAGDLQLTGGKSRGQGVLLVNGSLKVTGQFTFAGLIVAREQVEFGGGSTVYGAVMSMQNAGAQTRLVGNSSLIYSSCAVANALANLGGISRIGQRPWAGLY